MKYSTNAYGISVTQRVIQEALIVSDILVIFAFYGCKEYMYVVKGQSSGTTLGFDI